jgi:hypothetical protein
LCVEELIPLGCHAVEERASFDTSAPYAAAAAAAA